MRTCRYAHDVDDPVDEAARPARGRRTCCQRYLGRAVDPKAAVAQSEATKPSERDEVIDGVGLHALFDGEAHECRRETMPTTVSRRRRACRMRRWPADDHEREDWVHARFVSQRR